jgi:hypothetical protein
MDTSEALPSQANAEALPAEKNRFDVSIAAVLLDIAPAMS